MRIVTWNVNSIRARADRVAAFLDRSDADVLAIQELKCKESQFPQEIFTSRGYEVAMHGINQWNGVAIASRVGLEQVEVGFPGVPGFNPNAEVVAPPASPAPHAPASDPTTAPNPGSAPDPAAVIEARAISIVTTGGVRVSSLYVPNGRELTHPHYTYKLTWLAALAADTKQRLTADTQAKLVLCGDFNVAPLDEDVWDMAEFDGATHVSQPERDAFNNLLNTGLTEVTRPFTPGPGVYTFWDYKQLRFPKKQGMRIDFQLASPALAPHATAAVIDRNERKGKGASDHAPVWVDYDV